MKNVLNIYKFSFPFIEYRYERAIFIESISDIERSLKYEGIYIKTYKKNSDASQFRKIHFIWWCIEVTLRNSRDFYVPSYQLSVYFNDIVNDKVLSNLIEIFTTFKIQNYVFEYWEAKETLMRYKNIITTNVLEQDFKSFNEKKIKKFLTTSNKKYINETLKNHYKIRNSFTFLIYICFVFYKNNIYLEQELQELTSVEKKVIHQEYKWLIHLNITRLENIDAIWTNSFKKYNKILSNFFKLLS